MKSTPRDGVLRGGRATLVRLLLLAAAAVSGYLLSVSLNGGPVAGCGPGTSCDAVLQSPWAYVFGVPVTALALVVDLALLVTTFSCGSKSTPRQRRGAWEILAAGSVLVLGAALWFTALQAVVLRRFCPWCLAAHACGAVAAALLLTRLPVTDAPQPRDKDPAVPRARVIRFCALSLIAVALLGVAQIFAPGKTYSISVVPTAVDSTATGPATNVSAQSPVLSQSTTSPAAPTNGRAALTNHPPPRVNAGAQMLEVFGGRVRIDLAQAPIWGSPNAPHKLISLFDYTCHHCREMHERVGEVQRSFGDKLAVVSLPMPLDTECNPVIRRTSPPQKNACVYARLGLAVWRAKREAMLPFDDWLFGFQNPPPLAEVTNKVQQLIGASAFEQTIRDPWIDAQLRSATELFAISMREYRQGNMPQFMIGTNIITGMLTTEQLREKIAPYVTGPR